MTKKSLLMLFHVLLYSINMRLHEELSPTKYGKTAPLVRINGDLRNRFTETLSALSRKHSGGPGKSRLSDIKQAEIVGVDDPCTALHSERLRRSSIYLSHQYKENCAKTMLSYVKFSRVHELKQFDFERRLFFVNQF